MKVSRELLGMRADHAHGRRPVQVGDVLQDVARGDPTAVVVDVRTDDVDRFLSPINVGVALLEWECGGKKRYTERRLETLRQLLLVRVGAPVDNSPAAKHRQGRRAVQAGDVLREAGREAVVVDVRGGRARLNWIETGRASHRSTDSLRWMMLVREGTSC
jgi:rhodanese-related sulfurtransferase